VVAASVVVLALAVAWRAPRYAAPAAAAAAILALPRLLLYDLSYLLVGAVKLTDPPADPQLPGGSGSLPMQVSDPR
jgi:hypothetical protein